MNQRVLILLGLVKFLCAQNNQDFSTNFLQDYEEVTKPPLKSIGALAKCGEGPDTNNFVCVPYYNCNPETKMVQTDPLVDGTNKINIRMQTDDAQLCENYLEVCCRLDPKLLDSENTQQKPDDSTDEPVDIRKVDEGPVTKPTLTSPPPPILAKCGIRNNNGLDFNLVGGTNEANYGEFPWMVAILRKNPKPTDNLAICGGSLISPKVVLTSAHCVHNVIINEIKIRAGEWDSQTENERIPHQERNVAHKIVHEHFIMNNLYNDVALLILDRPFSKSESIDTVCLPEQGDKFSSRECFATGWGKTNFGQKDKYAVILKKLQLPLVETQDCQNALRKTRLGDAFRLHRSFICAGGEPNVDPCTGDGGSPLVCPDPQNSNKYLQVGIVAWGIGCGENEIPGVYADVASFRTWIDHKLQANGIPSDSYTQ